MAEIEKKVDDLTLNPPAADKPQGKPKEKKAKKPVAEGSYPLEVLFLDSRSSHAYRLDRVKAHAIPHQSKHSFLLTSCHLSCCSDRSCQEDPKDATLFTGGE